MFVLLPDGRQALAKCSSTLVAPLRVSVTGRRGETTLCEALAWVSVREMPSHADSEGKGWTRQQVACADERGRVVPCAWTGFRVHVAFGLCRCVVLQSL